MRICDCCGGSDNVMQYPWGKVSDQRDRGTYPEGHFDLCGGCKKALKEGGVQALVRRAPNPGAR